MHLLNSDWDDFGLATQAGLLSCSEITAPDHPPDSAHAGSSSLPIDVERGVYLEKVVPMTVAQFQPFQAGMDISLKGMDSCRAALAPLAFLPSLGPLRQLKVILFQGSTKARAASIPIPDTATRHACH